jgi:WhiB family redox-sensing transcriptional regulator
MARILQARAMGAYSDSGSAFITGRAGHYLLRGWGDLQPWEAKAACRSEPLETFFGQERGFGVRGASRSREQTRQAKAICSSCPVLSECRTWALESGIPYGVIGGLGEQERYRIRKAARAQAG